MLSATFLIVLGFLSGSSTSKFANTVEEVDEIVRTHSYAMILLSKTNGCPSCRRYEQILQENLEELEDMYQCSLTIVRDSDELVQRYGIESIPRILLFREGNPAIYPPQHTELSPEELIFWVNTARTSRVLILNDATFEYYTQATTGATTGDWLVAFVSARSPALTAKFEGLEAAHRSVSINFALVDYTQDVNLKRRFDLSEDTLLFFSEGEMFRFPGLKWDTASIMDFVNHFEERAEAEEIPLESSTLDYFFDKMTRVLQEGILPSIQQFTTDLKTKKALALIGMVMVLVLVLAFFNRGSQKKEKSQ